MICLPSLLPFTEIFSSSCRWKTHKWRRCQLVPWSIQQDVTGAQDGCGPGRQARGGRQYSSAGLLCTSPYSLFYLYCCLVTLYNAIRLGQSTEDRNSFDLFYQITETRNMALEILFFGNNTQLLDSSLINKLKKIISVVHL